MAKKDMLMYLAIAIVALIAWQMFATKKSTAKSVVPPKDLGAPSDVSGGPGSLQLSMGDDNSTQFGLHL